MNQALQPRTYPACSALPGPDLHHAAGAAAVQAASIHGSTAAHAQAEPVKTAEERKAAAEEYQMEQAQALQARACLQGLP